MKVFSVVVENENLVELEFPNLGITRRGRDLKRANKATKQALGDETRQMEIELLTFIRNAGFRTATPTIVKNYLKQKGLGTIGNSIVDDVVAKIRGPEPVGLGRREPPVTGNRSDTPTPPTGSPPEPTPPTGSPPAPTPPTGSPTGSPPEPTPPTGSPTGSPTPPALAVGTKAKLAGGEEFVWQGAQWKSSKTGRIANRSQKQELNQTASMQTNSMYEAAPGAEPALSNRQVRAILKQVIQKGYGQSAGFDRSRFASDTQDPAEVQAMIDALKRAGYKVTK